VCRIKSILVSFPSRYADYYIAQPCCVCKEKLSDFEKKVSAFCGDGGAKQSVAVPTTAKHKGTGSRE
jgi:transcription initiation factor TFIIIB Brf1 subunit/transcription initiation factor TFIIB